MQAAIDWHIMPSTASRAGCIWEHHGKHVSIMYTCMFMAMQGMGPIQVVLETMP